MYNMLREGHAQQGGRQRRVRTMFRWSAWSWTAREAYVDGVRIYRWRLEGSVITTA